MVFYNSPESRIPTVIQKGQYGATRRTINAQTIRIEAVGRAIPARLDEPLSFDTSADSPNGSLALLSAAPATFTGCVVGGGFTAHTETKQTLIWELNVFIRETVINYGCDLSLDELNYILPLH